MWTINLKATNEQDKQTHGHRLQTSGYQRLGSKGRVGGRQGKGGQIQEDRGRVKWVKGIKYMVAEGNWTLGGNHTIEYIDAKLYCTPENYRLVLTSVTLINLI